MPIYHEAVVVLAMKANSSDMPEINSPEYVEKPEGEMDMMIGFFLMNGFCIAFFLIFGMCVICSCMRQRPKMLRRKRKEEKSSKASTPPPPPAPQPLFKTLVSKAIRSGQLDRLKTESIEDLEAGRVKKETTVSQGINSTQELNDNAASNRNNVTVAVVPDTQRKKSIPRKSSIKPAIAVEEDIELPDTKSIIRQNLLGPLSFDDLYYT